MTHSLNEIEALAKRAARGAGLSWGMAEEAGKACRWLEALDLPGAGLLADVLAQNDQIPHQAVAPQALDGCWTAQSGTLCPLASGAALNDCADFLGKRGAIAMAGMSHPLLVVPFAAWASVHLSAPVVVAWLDIRIGTDGTGVWIEGPATQLTSPRAPTVRCSGSEVSGMRVTNPAPRGHVCWSVWEHLDALAQRTYAPATAASRRLGAGSGLSDYD